MRRGCLFHLLLPASKKEAKSIAQLQALELEKGASKWKFAMVFYVIGQTPTITAVSRYVSQTWNHVSKPSIYLHEDGYFVINFVSAEDRDSVIQSGPHLYFGKPIILKTWTPQFHFHNEVLRIIPIWIKLPNLPLNCWTSDSLSRIGSLLGVPICADECTTRQPRISFARLLIEMDVTKELPKSIAIQDPTGTIITQEVVYDWLPHFARLARRWAIIVT